MQTIKLNNKSAFEILTLVERTISRTKEAEQDSATIEFYKNLMEIEKSLHESCPELVKRWNDLQEIMHSVHSPRYVDGDWIPDTEGIARFKKASEEFDKWLEADK